MIPSNYLIFSKNEEFEINKNEINLILTKLLVLGLILAGIRQYMREYLDYKYDSGEKVDPVIIGITMILTATFYLILLIVFKFVAGNNHENSQKYRVTIVKVIQLAILREILYITFVLNVHGLDLQSNYIEDYVLRANDIFIFMDITLWLLTIILLTPLIIERTGRNPNRDDTYYLSFSITFIIFWLCYIFNYLLLRIFIQIPFGREF